MKTIEVKTMYKDVKNELPTNTFECIVKMWNQFNDIVMNEVYWHSSFDVESNRKKIFLKGRVDDLELRIRDLIETFNTKEK
jgi:hypothetical protein